MIKRRNGGITERRKITPNPKTGNHGKSPQILKDRITERRKITPNPKTGNHGKSPQILKDRITERRKIPWNPKRRNNGYSAIPSFSISEHFPSFRLLGFLGIYYLLGFLGIYCCSAIPSFRIWGDFLPFSDSAIPAFRVAQIQRERKLNDRQEEE